MHEHIARALYYFEVHLLYASIVGFASHTHLLLDVVVPPEAEIARHLDGKFAPGMLLAIVESPTKRVFSLMLEKALALLDSHTAPASSWSDTEPRRGEIRHDVQQILKKLSQSETN